MKWVIAIVPILWLVVMGYYSVEFEDDCEARGGVVFHRSSGPMPSWQPLCLSPDVSSGP